MNKFEVISRIKESHEESLVMYKKAICKELSKYYKGRVDAFGYALHLLDIMKGDDDEI